MSDTINRLSEQFRKEGFELPEVSIPFWQRTHQFGTYLMGTFALFVLFVVGPAIAIWEATDQEYEQMKIQKTQLEIERISRDYDRLLNELKRTQILINEQEVRRVYLETRKLK